MNKLITATMTVLLTGLIFADTGVTSIQSGMEQETRVATFSIGSGPMTAPSTNVATIIGPDPWTSSTSVVATIIGGDPMTAPAYKG